MLIRAATVDDVPAIYEMLRESAIHQGYPERLVVTPENLREDGFGAEPRFSCLIAEFEGKTAGLALYFYTYSTWTSRRGLYLEDLYVREEMRGRGVGRALMSELTRIAEANGCRRFAWVVNAHNTAAVEFYQSIGAKALKDWVLMYL